VREGNLDATGSVAGFDDACLIAEFVGEPVADERFDSGIKATGLSRLPISLLALKTGTFFSGTSTLTRLFGFRAMRPALPSLGRFGVITVQISPQVD
jgi:hypothetical protein